MPRTILSILTIVAVILLLNTITAFAEKDEVGIPFYEVFTPDQYRSQSQNTAIAQTLNGFIYVTNQNGLLEYNGTSWSLTQHPFGMQPLSIDIDSLDQIFLGYDYDLGRMRVNSEGQLYFESFRPLLGDSTIVFENVWSTRVTPDGVFFEDWSHIFKWLPGETLDDPGTLTIVKLDEQSTFSRHNYLNGHHYITLYDEGLCEIVGDTIRPVENGSGLGEYLPFEILPYGESGLLLPSFIENEVEWLVFDGNGFTKYTGEIVNFSKINSPIHCNYIGGDLYSLSTELSGLILFNSVGDIINIFDRSFGLPDNVAHVPHLDKQNGLWIPLDYGIARIRMNSALTHYGYDQGLDGSITTMTRYKGTLFLATNSGIYKLEETESNQKNNSITPIADFTNWSWQLLEANGQLLISTYQGIFKMDHPDDSPEMISDAWSEPLASTHNGRRVFYGDFFDGIGSLKYIGSGKWQDEGYIKGTKGEVYEILAQNDSTLWLAIGGRSIERVTLTTDLKDKPTLIHRDIYGAAEGLPVVEMQYPFFYNGKFMTGNVLGLSVYDEEANRFFADTTISACLPQGFTEFINPFIDDHNRIWFESNDESGLCATPQANSTYAINHYLSQGVTHTFSSYCFDTDGVIWAGGSGGLLVRFDETLAMPAVTKISAIINSVQVNGNQEYSQWNIAPEQLLILPYSDNTIRFEYSIPEYGFSSQNQYSYQLTGLHEQPMSWTNETYRVFDGLREGVYTFEVKGKNIYGQVSDVSSFTFRILAPWYRTPLAYILYLISIAGLLLLYIKFKTSHVEKINKKLESLVVQRTSDLEKTVDDLHIEIIERERAETERKKMEEQLYHAQKMETIGRITGGIAHDFNNMLAIIKGHADLALLTLDPASPVHKEFDLILKTAEKAGLLSHQLLAYSRKQALSPSTINLNSIVKDIDEMLDSSVFKNVEIKIKCEKDLWAVNADRGYIEQSIFNLAINARDAMPNGGNLKIETQNFIADEKFRLEHPYIPQGEYVRLSVSDTGIGIPEEIRENIFEPFFTTKEQGKGTGLGLSSVYGTVKQSKGFLEVSSEVGLGTTFQILLPRYKQN